MNIIQYQSFDQVDAWRCGSNLLGKPQMLVYCYLIDGLLIDTAHPRIQRQLIQSLRDYHIDRIIVTHHHEDHSGNVEALKSDRNVSAYASPLCCELMKSPERVEFARWITWGQHAPADLIPLDTDILSTQQYKFDIINTPGHAPDQISLYEANEGWLFSGDIFINDYIKMYMRDEVMGDQILSLRKLVKLDISRLFCCHQPIMEDPIKRLSKKLQFLEDFYGKIVRLYQQGKGTSIIMKELGYRDDLRLKIMSNGQLSLSNMVRSAINTYDAKILED